MLAAHAGPSVLSSVALITEELPQTFWWDATYPIRGTEEFYCETARALHRRGLSVVVEKDPPFPSVETGTAPASERTIRLGAPRGSAPGADATVVCNPRGRLGESAGRRIIWSNLFGVPAARLRRLAGVDSNQIVCGISNAQRSQLDPQGTDDRVRIVPHGVDKSKYATDGSLRRSHEQRTGRRLALFSSSPDRGRDIVSRLAPRLAAQGVDVVMSGYPGSPGTAVMSDATITRHYKRAHYWLHPGLGNELFCLAAAKAQAAGCCPIVRAAGGLKDTVRTGHVLSADHPVADWEEFVLEAVRAPIPPVDANHLLDWDEATAALAQVLEEA